MMIYLAGMGDMPMTPHARRAPALPVVLEVLPWVPISEESPRPRSSSSSWMTTARPTMELAPLRGICTSVMVKSHASAVAVTLPRSPAWRSALVGAPCTILLGLKWGPVDMQPLVVSPNSWMWNPWRPAARPLMEPTAVVGPSPDCVKVTVPDTPAEPVRTTTAFLSEAETDSTAARPADTRVYVERGCCTALPRHAHLAPHAWRTPVMDMVAVMAAILIEVRCWVCV
mmetsp:Transcript_40158/g.99400  ORF Transcript_40158/g.99400 Transcript_40158/m.99400 type:complete len:228 (-) Transcript_40158:35-718(-)